MCCSTATWAFFIGILIPKVLCFQKDSFEIGFWFWKKKNWFLVKWGLPLIAIICISIWGISNVDFCPDFLERNQFSGPRSQLEFCLFLALSDFIFFPCLSSPSTILEKVLEIPKSYKRFQIVGEGFWGGAHEGPWRNWHVWLLAWEEGGALF